MKKGASSKSKSDDIKFEAKLRLSDNKYRLGELTDVIDAIGLADAENRSMDILSRIFEYYLAEFACAEGKNIGQFYTRARGPRAGRDSLATHGARL